jgi:hypothetical protein
MFASGVLQLLCEAEKIEQLEQPMLVDRVRQILERISPRSIRRVNINSRIVREQQLLWLEEIHRDPEHQVLWSEEIKLAKPNSFKRFWEDLKVSKEMRASIPKATPPRAVQAKRQFWRGLIGGASLSLLLILVSWVLYEWLKSSSLTRATSEPQNSPAVASSPGAIASSPSAPSLPVGQDPFVQAVRLAEQAAREGKSAQTAAEWLDLATRWQRASDLMGQVSSQDARYETAQDRIGVYHTNSKAALQQAEGQRGGALTAP